MPQQGREKLVHGLSAGMFALSAAESKVRNNSKNRDCFLCPSTGTRGRQGNSKAWYP